MDPLILVRAGLSVALLVWVIWAGFGSDHRRVFAWSMYAYGGTVRFEQLRTVPESAPVNPYRIIDAGDISFNPVKVPALIEAIEVECGAPITGFVIMRSSGAEIRVPVDRVRQDPEWFTRA